MQKKMSNIIGSMLDIILKSEYNFFRQLEDDQNIFRIMAKVCLIRQVITLAPALMFRLFK